MERQMDKKWTKGDQKDNLSFTALVRLKKKPQPYHNDQQVQLPCSSTFVFKQITSKYT